MGRFSALNVWRLLIERNDELGQVLSFIEGKEFLVSRLLNIIFTCYYAGNIGDHGLSPFVVHKVYRMCTLLIETETFDAIL